MIADLDPLVARGIALLIGTEPDIEVMGTYDSGDDAVVQAHRQRCDVVVMDVRLADLDGCAAARRLTDPAVRSHHPASCWCRRWTTRTTTW